MQLTREISSDVNLVSTVAEGSVRIRKRVFTTSLIVAANEILEWNCTSMASLTLSDLKPVTALGPEIVLLGSGPMLEFPEPEITAYFGTQGVGFEVMDTGAACRTYNLLVHEGRRVVAALIIAPPTVK